MKVAIEYNVLALNEANTYLMEKGHAGLPPGQLEHVHTFDTLLLHPYIVSLTETSCLETNSKFASMIQASVSSSFVFFCMSH